MSKVILIKFKHRSW